MTHLATVQIHCQQLPQEGLLDLGVLLVHGTLETLLDCCICYLDRFQSANELLTEQDDMRPRLPAPRRLN